jgi:hypothetical protein
VKDTIIIILLVLLALVASGHDQRPRAAIQDTTLVHRSSVPQGAPVADAPWQTCEPPRVPRMLINPGARGVA